MLPRAQARAKGAESVGENPHDAGTLLPAVARALLSNSEKRGVQGFLPSFLP